MKCLLNDAFRSPDNTFKRQRRVINVIKRALLPEYRDLSAKYPNANPVSFWRQTPRGLAACWAEDEPRILEIEGNCECDDSYLYFHAIGSGARSAYAAWRALGAEQLSQRQEGLALQVMFRILQVCIDTEESGVAEPTVMWVITETSIRKVSESHKNSLSQVADRDFLFSLSNPPNS